VTVELLLVLFLETEEDLNRTYPLRYFTGLCNNDARGISAIYINDYLSHEGEQTYSKMCAVTSFPATESLAIPSW